MARIKRHVLFDAVHGQLGDYVVKHYKYGAVLSRRPQMGAVPPSEKQIARQALGRAAGEYYRRVIADPALLMCYEHEARKKGFPISALTFRDYCRPPKVYAIDLVDYTGWAGSIIRAKAYDDTHVKAVEVTLRDETSNVLEHGQAVESERHVHWLYHATRDVPLGRLVTVEVVAVDLPGNRGMLQANWERKMLGKSTFDAPEPTAPSGTATPAKLDFDPRAG